MTNMTHTTSLEFSKFLIALTAPLTKIWGPNYQFYWFAKSVGDGEGKKKVLWVLRPRSGFRWEEPNERWPAFLLSDLPLVFREIGEKLGWGQIYHYCEENSAECCKICAKENQDCHERGNVREGFHGYIPMNDDASVWLYYFSRFSSTFAANPTEEGWREAEKITMEGMR